MAFILERINNGNTLEIDQADFDWEVYTLYVWEDGNTSQFQDEIKSTIGTILTWIHMYEALQFGTIHEQYKKAVRELIEKNNIPQQSQAA